MLFANLNQFINCPISLFASSHKATASVVQIYTSRLLLRRFLVRSGRAFLLRGITIVTSITTVTNTIATTNTILTTAAGRCRRRKIAHTGTHAAASGGRVSPVGRLDGQNFRLRRQRRRSLLVVAVAAAAAAAGRTGRAATSGAAATAGARRQVVLVLLLMMVMVLMAMVRRMIDGAVNEVRAAPTRSVPAADGFVVMMIGWSRFRKVPG